MKRLIILLSTLGLFISVNAFASGAVPENQLVTVPMQNAGFHVGADALYYQPSSSQLDYAGLATAAGNAVANVELKDVSPGYHWGFGVNAGYHFQGTGNDMILYYTRLHTSDSDNFAADTSGGTVIITPILNPNAQGIDRAEAKAKFKYDAFDLMFGQLVNIGHRFTLHGSAGLRAAKLDSTLDATYYEDEPANPTIYTGEQTNDFRGIGPRVALDGIYNLIGGLGFNAGIGTSLLIGNQKAKLVYKTISAPGNDIQSTDTITSKSHRHIVPEIDAKLGLRYDQPIGRGVFSISAGWKVIKYIDAEQTITATASPSAPSNKARSSSTITRSSFSNMAFNGPYLGFVFKE